MDNKLANLRKDYTLALEKIAELREIHKKLLNQWGHTEDGSFFGKDGESNTFNLIHNDMRKALASTDNSKEKTIDP